MIQIDKLDNEKKSVFLLALMELIIDLLSPSEGYDIAKKSLNSCWEWVETKSISADELFFFLENVDENDVMSYMDMESDEIRVIVWQCLAAAMSYTIWCAYSYEKKEYMPETIEGVDLETLLFFLDCFKQVYFKYEIAEELFCSIQDEKSVTREVIVKHLKECSKQ